MTTRQGRELVIDGLCFGLAAGFYLWIVSRPTPADPAIFRTTQHNLAGGLPLDMLWGVVVGMAASVALGALPSTRVWRPRLALACAGLYLSTISVAIGSAALGLAPVCTLAWMIVLLRQNARPRSGEVLLTLHAGAFLTALAFFHQWGWYSAAWAPFVENLAALSRLWMGG